MTSAFAFAVALAALLATPATAAPAKHSKPAVDMQQVEVPARQAPAAKPRTDMTPRLTVEQFIAYKRGRLDKLAGQQMSLLRRMIESASPDDAQLPDFYFRLGELCVERFRLFEHSARALDEAIFRAQQKEPPAPPATPPAPAGIRTL